jgi:hypothetical protein
VFTLKSVWRPPAPVARVWSVLADPRFTWPDWWPGLTAAATRPVVGPDGLAAAGTWADLRVRSPLGYSLQFRLDLRQTTAPSDGEPGRALLDVSGDLTGRAEVAVRAVGGGASGSGVSTGSTNEGSTDGGPANEESTEVQLLWLVSPVPAWFRIAARIGPAPLAWAHAHVMRAGERGLAERLRG